MFDRLTYVELYYYSMYSILKEIDRHREQYTGVEKPRHDRNRGRVDT